MARLSNARRASPSSPRSDISTPTSFSGKDTFAFAATSMSNSHLPRQRPSVATIVSLPLASSEWTLFRLLRVSSFDIAQDVFRSISRSVTAGRNTVDSSSPGPTKDGQSSTPEAPMVYLDASNSISTFDAPFVRISPTPPGRAFAKGTNCLPVTSTTPGSATSAATRRSIWMSPSHAVNVA